MKKNCIYIIIAIIIIVGIIIGCTKKFNKELIYSERNEMILVSEEKLDKTEIENIANEVLTDRKVIVQRVNKFRKGDSNYSN